MDAVDAVVVGAGPNGLAAAVTLAEHGLAVRVYEAAETVGGGCRTAELTLPGFRHDVCSSAHPLATASPFFRRFDLAGHGVVLEQPEVPYAHPLDGGRAAVSHRSVDETAAGLGGDGPAYRRLMAPLARDAVAILDDLLGGGFRAVPRHPREVLRYGLPGMRPAAGLLRGRFAGEEARALLGGAAAHAMMPLDRPPTAGFGLLLGMLAHSVGWPVVRGGSQALADALAGRLTQLGGEVVTGHRVRQLGELPRAAAVLLDVTPRQLLAMAADELPPGYRRALRRFRYGPGVCKVDYALAGPVPWTNQDCRRAGTLHLGGTLAEVARAEAEVAAGRHPGAPFVLAIQPDVVDPTRAPAGRATLWAYCHVPSGSDVDMTAAIEAQIERFAPGFRDLVLARATRTAAEYEAYDANYVGGDVNSGVQDLWQTAFRPVPRWSPYATPMRGVYLCSASTPPGGGVHGMCGMNAARLVLRREFGIRTATTAAGD